MTLEASHLTDEQLALLASEAPDSLAREHLESCEECRYRWQQYIALQRALRALPSPPLPRDFTFPPESVAVLRPVPWWWRHRFSIRVGTLLAATLLVMLLSSALAFPGSRESSAGKRVHEQASPSGVAALAPQPTLAEAGRGGPSAPAVQSLEETPAPEGLTPSTFAFARPAETPPVPTNEAESETVQLREGLERALFLAAVTLLSVVTVLGVVLGFLFPVVRHPQRGARR
uniref:Zinc-finger domain-containing protein n=1 Tax=Thermomicrobium roseum TaxID=500 RepID=A0A7C1K4E9_THERO